ncbi:MAG: 3-hydroxyacyl-ACP dehydratase FabZ [Candidatus Eremiobacteraeota bacterium]|nr:3-hydroxyacyl-ACP dehydratase FabZ [Candidatus Eremiobacteraeota bacterium]
MSEQQLEKPVMDINQIMAALPHRYPFLLIDRITKIEGETKAHGIKQLTLNEEFFNGYLPDDPQLPPTLLSETMAQVGAAVIMTKPDSQGKYILFGALDNASFHRNARPGERLDIEAEMLRIRKDAGKTRIICRVGDEEIARADFMFALSSEVG